MASEQGDGEHSKAEGQDAISTLETNPSLLSTDEHFFDLPTLPDVIVGSPSMVVSFNGDTFTFSSTS